MTSDQERAAPAQQPVACPVLSEELVEQAWLSLLNVDDRTSPEEYPDMALIRFDELREIIASFVTASEPELRAEIVRLTRERDEHERMRTLYVTSAQEEHARAEAAELRVEALSAALEQIATLNRSRDQLQEMARAALDKGVTV